MLIQLAATITLVGLIQLPATITLVGLIQLAAAITLVGLIQLAATITLVGLIQLAAAITLVGLLHFLNQRPTFNSHTMGRASEKNKHHPQLVTIEICLVPRPVLRVWEPDCHKVHEASLCPHSLSSQTIFRVWLG